MKLTLAMLVVAVVAMAVWIRSQSTTIRELEKAVEEVRAKSAEKPSGASLDLQAKCSEQARKAFVDMGYTTNQLAGYENHYNLEMNKCFIHIQNTDAKIDPGTIWTYRNVFDAFERNKYGTYAWHTEKGKKYWEVPPFECEVMLPSGEKKLCESNDEFTELVQVYMGSR